MSLMSDFEDRIGRAVEGMFAGVFRAPVQPAELARACAKEMDKQRRVGVGKVYAPNMFSVLLSPRDGSALGAFADTLSDELANYLYGHAHEKGYDLSTKPRVRFLVDDGLKLGRYEVIGESMTLEQISAEVGDDDGFYDPEEDDFGAAARRFEQPAPSVTVTPPATPVPAPVSAPPAPLPTIPEPAPTMVHAAVDAATADQTTVLRPTQPAMLHVEGLPSPVVLDRPRFVIGRLQSCDIRINDRNVSRQHAAIEREGSGWVVTDLGSTNGTTVNGSHIKRVRLLDGDRIQVGATHIDFSEASSP